MESTLRRWLSFGLVLSLGCTGEVSGGEHAKSDASMGSDAGDASSSPLHPKDDASAQQGDAAVGAHDGGGNDKDAASEVGSDAGADAGPHEDPGPPPGKVAMFVASGNSRTATSCDGGKTWTWYDNDKNNQYVERGLAFGDGVFLQVRGWGAVCSFLRSEDGVTWQHLSMADVGLNNITECSGVIYTGDGFTMMHSGGEAYGSTDGGKHFSLKGMFDNNMEHVRESAGGGPAPGIILAGGANEPWGSIKNPPHVSVDGGKTWKATPGCSTLHALSTGQNGGGALGGKRMVYVGFLGEVCTSDDMVSWQEKMLPGFMGGMGGTVLQGKVSYDGQQFWAADRDRVFLTKDGVDWTEQALTGGVHLHYVAKGGKVWVGFDRDTSTFYRSADGKTWTAADTSPPTETDIFYRIVYGYGDPSTTCPLP